MKDSDKSIFRKSSLERISSPEQLNEYIKIVNPGLVMILASIFLILLGCSFWFFSGRIPKYLDISGVSITSKNGIQKVYCYVPISTAKRLRTDMAVQMSPDYAPKEQYGYIKGSISRIGENIVTENYLSELFDNPQIVSPVISDINSNLIQVEINLEGWSSNKGELISISDGSLFTVSVVEREQKPYELIFNA